MVQVTTPRPPDTGNRRWLVTGCCGFIGTNFVRMLLADPQGPAILNLDCLTYAGRRENLAEFESNPRYHFSLGDIGNAEAVETAFASFRPHAVVHFAAESHVDRSIGDASQFIHTNVGGTQILLDAARRHSVERFLQVSTDEVYGSLGPTGSFREDSPMAPNSPYAASKAGGDLLARAAGKTHGLPVIITRGSNNYGPYQFPEKLIPLAIANASADRTIPLYGTGLNVRNWIHVEDHCRGIVAALERGEPGRVYNLGGADEVANLDLLEQLLSIMGKSTTLIRRVADRPGHDMRYSLDSTRAHQELGWRPRIRLSEGMAATVEWYQRNAAWLEKAHDTSFQDYYRQQYESRLAGEGKPVTAKA